MDKIIKKKLKYELNNVAHTLVAVLVSFISVWVFIEPADFSPSGVEGITRILQELTGVNMGYFKLLINIPLLVIAWKFLNTRYMIYVLLFTLFDAVGVILLDELNFYQFSAEFIPDYNVGHRLIASIFSGVALGVTTGLMLKIGCSTGGVDIIACLIHRKKPFWNIERLIACFCYVIIGCSYFVFWDLTSILLSIIQIFVFESTSASILRKERFGIEVKIITKDPECLREEILYTYKHSATIIESKGMYSGNGNYMIVCVVNSRDITDFMSKMKKHPDTFVYYSDGVRVQGDFHFGKEEEVMSAYK